MPKDRDTTYLRSNCYHRSNCPNRSKKQFCLFVLLSVLSLNCLALEILLPRTTQYNDRDSFEIELLDLLLTKIPGQHTVNRTGMTLTQGRVIRELSKEDGLINLYWMGTSQTLEQELRAIYFPIYRGLIGYRAFIINKDQSELFTNIDSIGALRNLIGVQGIGWADTELLEASGLKQLTAPYENIFEMMDKSRAHYFSRSILEIEAEIASRRSKMFNIAVDSNVLLTYPFAMYYFTNDANEELALQLEKAFEKAYEDGSFINFFYNHPKTLSALNLLHSTERQTIRIDNPFFSEKSRLVEAKYWHR